MAKVLIIEARFYDHINDGLLAGANRAFEAAGITCDRVTVPGIYEIPAAMAMVLEAQKRGTGPAYDGFLTLGCAIRGESDHYHYICGETMRGLNDLAVRHTVALGNGVLTVHNEAQALHRCDPERKDFGGQAARACLRMMELRREMKL